MSSIRQCATFSLAQSLVVTFCFLFLSPLAHSQWTQTVSVDIEAENAVIAKEKALALAEEEAAFTLLQQIAPAAAGLQALHELGAKCSAGYEVSDEKFSSNRYLARIHQQFHKKCVLGQLKAIGITPLITADGPHKTAKTHPLLLIARRPDGSSTAAHLWEESFHLAHDICNSFAKSHPGLAFPLYDLNDQRLMPEVNLEDISFAAFEKLAAHYQTDHVNLVVIEQTADATLISAYKVSPLKTHACPVRSLAHNTNLTQDQLSHAISTQALAALDKCTPPQLATLAKQLPHGVPAIPGGPHESKTLTLTFANGAQYLHLKKALLSLSCIHNIKVAELTSTYAVINIDLIVPFASFQQEGEQIGLKIIENSDQTIEVNALT